MWRSIGLTCGTNQSSSRLRPIVLGLVVTAALSSQVLAQAPCPPGFTAIVIPPALGGGTTCSANTPPAGSLTSPPGAGGLALARAFLGIDQDKPSDPLLPDGLNFEDPYGSYSSYRMSSLPTSAGSAASSRETIAGAGGDGHLNINRLLDMQSGNKQFILGGYFNYNRIKGSFDDLNTTYTRNVYVVGITPALLIGDSFITGRFAESFGDGSVVNGNDSGSGSFRSSGFSASVSGGHVFTLVDRRTFHDSSPRDKRAAVQDGGYQLKLSAGAGVSYFEERIGGFIDSAGVAQGNEVAKAWKANLSSRLYADVYGSSCSCTLSPYVQATLSQIIDWDHYLDTASNNGTISIDSPGRTIGTFAGGLSILTREGINTGVEAFLPRQFASQRHRRPCLYPVSVDALVGGCSRPADSGLNFDVVLT